jgi:dipeptidyl aminopeptidase/acylaminoacyl peptidase
MPASHRPARWLLPATLLLVPLPAALAQQAAAKAATWSPREALTAESYVKPPAEIERLVTAPRQSNVALQNLGPDRKYFLVPVVEGLPTVQTFGKPHYYFGGLQVDFKANRARVMTTRGAAGLALVDATSGQRRTIETPRGASISSPKWSPDGRRVAYIANFDDASRVYVADVASGKSRQLAAQPLLATLVSDVDWTADGKSLVAVVPPLNRRAAPVRPAVETGPLVRLTDGHKDKTRTYASLLRDPYDMDLMEYYVTGQLALFDANSGAVKRVGAPAVISDVSASPDGKHFRVTLLRKPFSYIVQYTSFPQAEQLWDADGKLVTELATRPLRESDVGGDDDAPGPRAGADTAKRDFQWLPDGSIAFLQQEPAPNGARNADSTDVVGAASGQPLGPRAQGGPAARRRDRLVKWAPPFDASSRTVLLESDTRIGGVLFSPDAKMAFVAENANGTGTVYATYFAEPGKRYPLWRVRGLTASVGTAGRGFGGGGRGGTGADSVAFYQNPGQLVTVPGRVGAPVALLSPDGQYAYTTGVRYDRNWQQNAPRGFADKIEIRTGKTTPIFQGGTDAFETVVTPVDDAFSKFVVMRESPKAVPDGYLRDAAGGQLTKLTSNTDFTPEFTNLQRRRVWVTRADGFRFVVNVTLPENYQAGTRLPGMFWFYPYEYTDSSGYQRTLRANNINQFPNAGPRTIEYLATQGYAVANFDPPIVGVQGRMNDNYVSDLQANLIAVIDELDRQGFIDRQRLGIGGHSYGAFSTLNALTHTPYFKAGIAGDGMYNRSLTPNGFQSERRDFWEAQKTYLEMSPFFYADKLQGALLMYHSLEDQNVGTDPISSIRMMHALQGLGKTAALYMYPYEDHGPATKETLLDQWARWVAWLDTYVKNGAKKPVTATDVKAMQ